ncbi:hypothetical protein LTR08_008854 [Meristemomyces frigidus]|nr:hypothetical protein LTR08_008854 [Meristemomyces frigidus]
MPSLSFVTVDVFTTERFAGNPLAVVNVPKGHVLTTEQMQRMAKEFNLSETVILHEGVTGDDGVPEWSVRIFLTDAEVPFAGHPTIGTACYALGTLAKNAGKGRLLCKAGPIDVDYEDGRAKASIPHNVHLHRDAQFNTAQLYGLQPALGDAGAPKAIDIVSPVNGMSFICAELPSLEALAAIEMSAKPKPQLDEGWDTGFVGSYFYVVLKHESGGMELRTRMIEGSFEDPATGSAACALSAFLAMKQRARTMSFTITQGVEMGRKSDIGVHVTLKESLDAVEKVELIGSAVKVMEGSIEYE